MAVTGRKPDDRELHPGKIDSVYSDILIAVLCFLVVLWYLLAIAAFETGPYDTGVLTAYQKGTLVIFGIITLSVTALCEMIVLAIMIFMGVVIGLLDAGASGLIAMLIG